MLLASLLSWWYGLGWIKLMQKVGSRVMGVMDFFSVGQLAGSLFAPYRQISADRVQGSAAAQLSAFGDRLFSRAIGAVIRSILILSGLATAATLGLIGLILIATWPLIPVLPIVGIFLMQLRLG